MFEEAACTRPMECKDITEDSDGAWERCERGENLTGVSRKSRRKRHKK